MPVFRKTSGSILCYACGRLNRADADVCFHCGRRHPGLWGWAPLLGRVLGRVDFARIVIAVCIGAYVAALVLDPRSAFRARGPFGLLAPSTRALFALGMTGWAALDAGRWWTLLTAIYLHGGLLHIVFNLLWVNQLAPPVEALYGRARLIVIFTVAGVVGFLASAVLGAVASVGASGGIFGLLGAMVCYGRRRGGFFGSAVLRQYWGWALVLFLMGFLMTGVDNAAHAGGFVGGYAAALVLGYEEERRETGVHRLLALAAGVATALSFALALWTAFGP